MNGHDLLNFSLWKLISILKAFIILYICILFGEWLAEKRGYNLFERTLITTIVTIFILTFVLLGNISKVLFYL
jgi:quinol-cytochrome oxidoreductase complex cytochrome b subunit